MITKSGQRTQELKMELVVLALLRASNYVLIAVGFALVHGLSIDREAERVWSERYQGPMSLSEYASTSGICLYTANGCYINVPFVESFTQASGARFIFDGEFAVVLQEK